jgi:hypothetical protein
LEGDKHNIKPEHAKHRLLVHEVAGPLTVTVPSFFANRGFGKVLVEFEIDSVAWCLAEYSIRRRLARHVVDAQQTVKERGISLREPVYDGFQQLLTREAVLRERVEDNCTLLRRNRKLKRISD